jgi:hypothetical protein
MGMTPYTRRITAFCRHIQKLLLEMQEMSEKSEKCRHLHLLYSSIVDNFDIMHRIPQYFNTSRKKLIQFVEEGWTDGKSFYNVYGLHPDSYLDFAHDVKKNNLAFASIAVPPPSFYSMAVHDLV